jgi:hypothetical protein
VTWQRRVAQPDPRPNDQPRAVTGAPTATDVRPRSERTAQGRDTAEPLYDLTFVVAFGVAAEQLAHLLAEGHFAAGLVGFVIAIFAVCWCWINYSWFASAYDRRRAAAGRERVIAVPRPVSLSRLVWLLQVLINVCGGDRAFADS